MDKMSVASSTGGDDLTSDETSGQEERILVSVRLRPLNEREIVRNDVSDWECINNSTIIFKSNMPERSMFPTAYTFDRVFRSDCLTKQVYEEGVKEIALLAVSGVNSTIFAYGQTSSGKTYTMRGITEYALADIYEYMGKHKEREFVLKFSAMEIYNEAVRDLLSTSSSPLRLLDDPERGTVVEGLIEDTLVDWNHLLELISICEDQRQIGETTLNETSSRSHQILRLTVESSARGYLGAGNSTTLTATVNFVDLAGSERASQTLAVVTRLKEGSHINRSLLTLGTVIRKLSKGRNGHIPYRDSKLTRILQNSLGGNARTAIICTLSPARSHVEQSRNTLLFASCAKEVTTNAHVNLVMSDKTLVKKLQKEVARLESELKSAGSNSLVDDSTALLREKELQLQIEKMHQEIQDLTWQRDQAESHLQSLLESYGIKDQVFRMDDHSAPGSSEMINAFRLDADLPGTKKFKDFDYPGAVSPNKQIVQIPEIPEGNFLMDGSTPKFSGPGWEDIGKRNSEDAKDICEEVPGTIMVESRRKVKKEAGVLFPVLEEKIPMQEGEVPSSQEEDKELIHINSNNTNETVKQKIQELHETINHLERSPSFSDAVESSYKNLKWTRSKSRRSVLMTIPYALWSEKEEGNGRVSPTASEKDFPERSEDLKQKLLELEHDVKLENKSEEDSQNPLYGASAEEDVIKDIDVDVEDTTSVLDFVAGVNKMAAKLHSENLSRDMQASTRHHHSNWQVKYERYRRKIIELWSRCNVPLVHRSYFFLLFKGDPSDNVYMEVELRRLYFLKDTFSSGANTIIDGKIASPASSLKALSRERDMLAKQLQKKYTKTERERLYQKWGIPLDTKQRSLQLARRLWTDARDMRHIKDSATLVAKLAGIVEPRHAPKEMFGLSFSTNQKPASWRDNMSSLL